MTVCRRHPGCPSLRHHHAPLPTLILRRTALSFLDRHRSPCTPSSRSSVPDLEASRLALSIPRRITAARGRVIRSSIVDLRTSPTSQTQTTIRPGPTIQCPAVCASTSRGCRDCVVNKCHEGYRPDHLEWLEVQTVIPSRPNHLLCCEDRPAQTAHHFPSDLFLLAEADQASLVHKPASFELPHSALSARQHTPNFAGRPRNLSRGADCLLRLRRKDNSLFSTTLSKSRFRSSLDSFSSHSIHLHSLSQTWLRLLFALVSAILFTSIRYLPPQ